MTSQITDARQAVITAINNSGLTFVNKYLFENTNTLEDIPQPGPHELPAIMVDHAIGASGELDLIALGVYELRITIEITVWTRFWNAEQMEELIQQLLIAVRVNSAAVKQYRPDGVRVGIQRIRLSANEATRGPAAMQGRITLPLTVRYC